MNCSCPSKSLRLTEDPKLENFFLFTVCKDLVCLPVTCIVQQIAAVFQFTGKTFLFFFSLLPAVNLCDAIILSMFFCSVSNLHTIQVIVLFFIIHSTNIYVFLLCYSLLNLV